jgi:hypothetical protein
VSIQIVPGGTPPTVTITSPTSTQTFRVGEVVTLSANASAGSTLTWEVIKHHAEHTHPFLPPTNGNNLTITTEGPEDLLAAINSYLEIKVTATGSNGLSTTVTRDFQPTKVNLTFATNPPGLKVVLDNTFTQTAPSTVVSWRSWGLRVRADDQVKDGVGYVFQSWSDGGARDHVITTPASPATYTANFVEGQVFAAKINFQPAASPAPTGYLVDSGAVFGNRGNGHSYGWNAATNETRDRNLASSPDQRYDTLNHMQKASNPNASWEIAVPNGSYQVHLVAGDPGHFDSVFKIAAEGTLLVDGTPTTGTRWIEGTKTVNVTDGRLTLTNAAGASNNKVCFVEITKL